MSATVLQDSPTRYSGFAIDFPQTTSPEKRIPVIASLHSARQVLHHFDVTATEDNGIGDERKFYLRHAVKHFLAPRFFAETLKPVYAQPVFNFAVLAVRQIAKLEWQKVLAPDQGRTEAGAQPEKKHATANMTAECLHGSVVNDQSGLFQGATEIEPDPTFSEMFRVLYDLAFAHNRRKPDGNSGEL